ncbi:MAG TPA: hypothetical protein VFS30_08550 [Dehalococcoidia bacterium]|nr:hypothetical protein [Dehalococcoidia bacterium]
MDAINCGRCGVRRDVGDNFCRACGHQFTVNLPAVKANRLPAVKRGGGLPPSLVGSVAVLAVGTSLEWLARRMVGSAARAAGRALVGADTSPTTKPAPRPDDVTVDEVLYVRKVQLRR